MEFSFMVEQGIPTHVRQPLTVLIGFASALPDTASSFTCYDDRDCPR
jgi:hypothetical protein